MKSLPTILRPSILLHAAFILCGVAASSADVFRVGPDGDHPTLQSALDAASTLPGNHEFRVQLGYHLDPVRIQGFVPDVSWRITGGFGATFSTRTRSRDAAATVFDGQDLHRVFDVWRADGVVLLEDLTIASGFVDLDDPNRPSRGAGMLTSLSGSARLILRNVTVRDNRALEDIDSVSAGGISAHLRDQASLEIEDCAFRSNVAQSVGRSDASAAGLDVDLEDRSKLLLVGTRFEDNEARVVENQATAAAAILSLYDGASAIVHDIEAVSNRLVTGSSGNAGTTAMLISSNWVEGGSIEIDRSRFVSNEVLGRPSEFSPAVYLIGDGPGLIRMRNTILADNISRGLNAEARAEAARVELVNLTVSRNGTGGFATAQGPGKIEMFNSIVYDHAVDLDTRPGTFIDSSNLIGIDPRFEDTVDFEPSFGSPAIDFGRTDVPIGRFDVDGDDRVFGASVDAGAQEAKPTVPPATPCRVDGLTLPVQPVCLCLRQSGSQEFRCGVQLPDVFLDFGFDLQFRDPIPMRMALLPRQDLRGIQLRANGFKEAYRSLDRWQTVVTKGAVVPTEAEAGSTLLFEFEATALGTKTPAAFQVVIPLPKQ